MFKKKLTPKKQPKMRKIMTDDSWIWDGLGCDNSSRNGDTNVELGKDDCDGKDDGKRWRLLHLSQTWDGGGDKIGTGSKLKKKWVDLGEIGREGEREARCSSNCSRDQPMPRWTEGIKLDKTKMNPKGVPKDYLELIGFNFDQQDHLLKNQ